MYIGLFWLTLGPVVGSCESGNERLCIINTDIVN
jgi:hypothetical protein